MPLPRMTTRRWMIAVAVVGLLLGWGVNRYLGFLREANAHEAQIVGVNRFSALMKDGRCIQGWLDAKGNSISRAQEIRDKWHHDMARKYREAARRPWLPVPPDPPEPK